MASTSGNAHFSPSSYLVGQGWAGPGSALKKGGLKKPVTVAHKTNLKGLGRERDTGYAWWDDVFSMVANKKKGDSAASEDSGLRKTSTGIFSSRPPSGHASGAFTPNNAEGTAVFNTDIIGQAKLEAARREFYSKFLRGKPLAGTAKDEGADEKTVAPEASTSASTDEKAQRKLEKAERKRLRAEKRERKTKRNLEKAEVPVIELPADSQTVKAGKKRKQSAIDDAAAPSAEPEKPKKRKKAKGAGSEPITLLPTPPPSDQEDQVDRVDQTDAERKAAKRARKEEKKRKRELKAA